MRVVISLFLLHVAFAERKRYSWSDQTKPSDGPDACLSNQASCGCCLMQQLLQRMQFFLNISQEQMHSNLRRAKMSLNNKRASRSAFSVALNSDNSPSCYGPFDTDKLIVYKQTFINLGGGYDTQTGIFTALRSGVYSISVTIYSIAGSSGSTVTACADLQVNGKVAATLLEQNGNDLEDSATVVVTVELKAGDSVAVNMPMGCFVCGRNSHYNTFTGFLLYPTD